jgi:uncharacterized protein (TIGR01777 family)
MTDTTATAAYTVKETASSRGSALRVVIPGGEGHLGRILARHFSNLGHEVTTFTRDPNPSRAPENHWASVHWDGRHVGLWIDALEGADVLINLAGRSVDCRYTARHRVEILYSRVRSTTVLGQALRGMKRPPRLWLNASTATIYGHTFDRTMTEATGMIGGNEPDAPGSWKFSIDVAQEWEKALFTANTPRTRKVAMRAAMVMSPEPGGIFDIILRLVRMGLGGPWGSGRQYMSWIHELDFCRAVEFLIERETIKGAVNLAAPLPVTNDEFMFVLRDAWGIDYGLPAREWMLSLGAFFLRTETELLLKSRRVVPGILRKHGFEFLFAEWPVAALDLVRQWQERHSNAAS